MSIATGNSVFGLNELARDRDHAPPYPIWLWAHGPLATDLRQSLTPVIARGLELCD